MATRRRASAGKPPATTGRRRTRRARPAAGASARVPVVTIRFDRQGLLETSIEGSDMLERLAEEWTYILRARARWRDHVERREAVRLRALEDLERLGMGREFVRRMAEAQHVEVQLHHWNEEDPIASRRHEAASILPWEYLVSAATRSQGRFRPMLITRVFENRSPHIVPPPPSRILFAESAPGRLKDAFDFGSERERIRAAVAGEGTQRDATMQVSKTETLTELSLQVRRAAGEKQPYDAIHVTGVDTHQAPCFLDDLYEEIRNDPEKADLWSSIADGGTIRDGMILRETNIPELPVNYISLAEALVPDEPDLAPYLVTLNLYHSGARLAREMVRRGAHASLGFLDEIDDELAELFFQAFYWAWCRPNGALAIPHAFMEAWQTMSSDRLHGTAIVIWLGHSVFDAYQKPKAATRGAFRAAVRAAAPPAHDVRPVGDLLQVDFDLAPEINYSLLHNDRPLFRKLTLTKLVKEALDDVTIQVELNLGTQNYPFRATIQRMTEPQVAMAHLVKIPLTAALPRSLQERVHSTVYVKVACGGRTVREDTVRVTLIPVDEWLDDSPNNPWLPSFVLPRDPAILSIVQSARRYLVGIRDDPSAGFDGYQSIDEGADDPTAGVDAQVRAIWTALVNDFRLQYINPPPAYSERTQRLRTPGTIVASNTGTCIDLALLLASCLEYIDVYPVLVLLDGHAFVGYWRSDTAHQEFTTVGRVPADVAGPGGRLARAAALPFVDAYGWRLTQLHYDEVVSYVAAGDLVMLEATYLTSASSFGEAVEEGRANLRSRDEFDSLLDVRLARSAVPAVTPLPILA